MNECKHFINREVSWLSFNQRVLEEARDKENPLLERCRFLAITASNLDEFFMVRVATLEKHSKIPYGKRDIAGLKPKEQLKKIEELTVRMIEQQYTTYNRMLVPLLKNENIDFVKMNQLSDEQAKFIKKYFNKFIYPVLTPMAVDSSRPFPLISNRSLNIAAYIQKKEKTEDNIRFVTVQVPDVIERVIQIPSEGAKQFILLEEIVRNNLDKLFIGYKVLETTCFSIIRDMDFEVEQDEIIDLVEEIEKKLRERDRGAVLRLDIEVDTSEKMKTKLKESIHVVEKRLHEVNGPIDLTFLSSWSNILSDSDELLFEPKRSYINEELINNNIFETITKKDVLLHHPYDSFEPVVELIRQASEDEQVLAIKMTLYRVSGKSPIIKSLERAAENGKEVTVLVELKARFDEENNINWAQRLEKAGCHVIYGLVGLKTHCKLTLIVRKEESSIKRYMHLGTGNYNDSTARFYTDMSLLTSDTQIGVDASNVFNMLSGYSEPPYFNKLVMAPLWLRSELMEQINIEIEQAKSGLPASIYAKMNSLSDRKIIEAFYKASQAGVKVHLIVRGICCLKPGVEGISDNITVHSIVGRYLEHTRIYMFGSKQDRRVFLASADLMPRNLDHRVELMFPVEDDAAKQVIIESFEIMLADNVKTRVMDCNGQYHKIDRRGKVLLHAQEHFALEAEEKIETKKADHKWKRTFIPVYGQEKRSNDMDIEEQYIEHNLNK
ncbi:MAG: RNA degradosome polyphosphate kinase [Bacillus sp. (in: firmicutes)]